METKAKKLCTCGRDCQLRPENCDESIGVSVSPRYFHLPKGTEKRTKMKIKNENPYPIYFKANTSNMSVFRALPQQGRILPNKKVSVDVEFYDSAMPLGRHERITVLTSRKPFEYLAPCKKRISPSCEETSDDSSHRGHKRLPKNYGIYLTDPHYCRYKKNGKLSRSATIEHVGSCSSSDEDFGMKYQVQKKKQKTRHYPIFMEQKKTEGKATENMTDRVTDYAKTYSKPLQSAEKGHKNQDYGIGKVEHRIESHELQEICIHALVHRPFATGCECRHCVELSDKESRRKVERYLISEKPSCARKRKGEEDIAEDRLQEAQKGAHALYETKGTKDESRDNFKCTKIISQEDYKRKKEKSKMKHLKQSAKDSENTSAEDSRDQKIEPGRETTMMEPISGLEALEEKCDRLARLSWASMFLVLLLMLAVIGGAIYCCRPEFVGGRYLRVPCLFKIFKYYG